MKTIKIRNKNKEYSVGKIICLGRNYAEHIKELGNEPSELPVIFLKPASALIYSKHPIEIPAYSQNMHHEIELVLLIGKKLKDANAVEAEEAIIAYGVGLDMTLRDVQDNLKKKGQPWTTAKCFDMSALVSDFLAKEEHKVSPEDWMTLKVNGVVRQRQQLNKMIFPPARIVEYISSFMTIEEGDLVFTGTPSGVSKVVKGDKLYGEITNVASFETEII
ncbi:MAG TPA: fumarylacetoacetate hydrolase family protein [Ignavibacteriaceae bacterium]|jgi:5-carboxymethyl-2-hydroxymuconate isomerase|nr:fumarylacetoacetate hydrolase family protein [Ignavibacteriaceae bacterium]HOJ17211.1 fumarylacetoacetate hydrolase family protein [Ignavibacteriaceae bacterium]